MNLLDRHRELDYRDWLLTVLGECSEQEIYGILLDQVKARIRETEAMTTRTNKLLARQVPAVLVSRVSRRKEVGEAFDCSEETDGAGAPNSGPDFKEGVKWK